MSNNKLSRVEARKSWVLRAVGWKVRDIGARFNVDPRRLYEVWSENTHIGSRQEALRLFIRLLPGEHTDGRFKIHKPQFEVRLADPNQFVLPGI